MILSFDSILNCSDFSFFSSAMECTITMSTFMCFADYWQTLSFWQIILIRLSQIVNAFEISLFSTLPFAKQILRKLIYLYTHEFYIIYPCYQLNLYLRCQVHLLFDIDKLGKQLCCNENKQIILKTLENKFINADDIIT